MYESPKQSNNFRDVGDFHTKFGLPVSEGQPLKMDREAWAFRLKFLQEEINELAEALGAETETGDLAVSWVLPEQDSFVSHPDAFDALIDLVYVALGTAHLAGYPWEAGWNKVQEANMAKVRASSAEESKRGSSLDVIKPEGWTPPNIELLLLERGWQSAEALEGGN